MKIENICVNADDFGRSKPINDAILQLFRQDILCSTSLMANMPGFEHAVELARTYKIEDKIGVHLVLTAGVPLTEEISEIPGLFDEKMDLSHLRKNKLFFLNSREKQIVYRELAAQIEKVRKHGIPVNHLDTHHQLHDSFSILMILLDLLKEYNIPYVRILNNLEKVSFLKNNYRKMINTLLKFKKVNYSDYFGNQIDFGRSVGYIGKGKKVEVMVHPDINESGKVIDRIGNDELDFSFLTDITKGERQY